MTLKKFESHNNVENFSISFIKEKKCFHRVITSFSLGLLNRAVTYLKMASGFTALQRTRIPDTFIEEPKARIVIYKRDDLRPY
jgi:hypothetical protein